MKTELNPPVLKANRPQPISIETIGVSFNRKSDINETIEALLNGNYVIVEDFYSNGLELLNEVLNYLKNSKPSKSFNEQRAFRSEYKKLSNLVLLPIKNHELKVKKAPAIGWLEKLYPEQEEFLLPFPQVQGLNSAWQWYQNGVLLPVLRNKIHPYYGVYFPTRFDHLILFDNWLKRYEGPKKSAIDVGVGSGVLSLQLIKHGFQKAFGTDTNPNAIIGLNESLEGTKLSRKIEIDYGHLFAKWEKPTELIVFNPPWLPASHKLERLDEAMYYNEQLFPEFFAEAKKRLLPDGKIVVLFSNLGQITEVSKINPIEEELKKGKRFVLEACLKRPVKAASEKTKRSATWRANEEVELWILKHQ